MPEIQLLQALVIAIGSLARGLRGTDLEPAGRGRGDAGYTTEAVIVIAGLAALAIAVLVIIVNKVTSAANNIPTQ
jgi:hypothetical protein